MNTNVSSVAGILQILAFTYFSLGFCHRQNFLGLISEQWWPLSRIVKIGDNHFWRGQTKTKICFQRIIHFIEIQNNYSKQIFIFFNSEYSFKTNIHLFKIPASKPHTNSWRWCFGFNANTNGDDDISEPGCLGVHFSTAQTCFCAGNPLCRDYTKILNVEMCNTSQFTFYVNVMN